MQARVWLVGLSFAFGCGRAPITSDGGDATDGATVGDDDGGGNPTDDEGRPGGGDGRPGGGTDGGTARPDVGTDPRPTIGDNPAGGNSVAHWEAGALRIEMSNLTQLTCEDDPLPECGPPDGPVWNASFTIPRERVGVGEFTEQDMNVFVWFSGPVAGDGACASGGGNLPTPDLLLSIDYIDDEIVKGQLKNFTPELGSDSAFSGDYFAPLCP